MGSDEWGIGNWKLEIGSGEEGGIVGSGEWGRE